MGRARMIAGSPTFMQHQMQAVPQWQQVPSEYSSGFLTPCARTLLVLIQMFPKMFFSLVSNHALANKSSEHIFVLASNFFIYNTHTHILCVPKTRSSSTSIKLCTTFGHHLTPLGHFFINQQTITQLPSRQRIHIPSLEEHVPPLQNHRKEKGYRSHPFQVLAKQCILTSRPRWKTPRLSLP